MGFFVLLYVANKNVRNHLANSINHACYTLGSLSWHTSFASTTGFLWARSFILITFDLAFKGRTHSVWDLYAEVDLSHVSIHILFVNLCRYSCNIYSFHITNPLKHTLYYFRHYIIYCVKPRNSFNIRRRHKPVYSLLNKVLAYLQILFISVDDVQNWRLLFLAHGC